MRCVESMRRLAMVARTPVAALLSLVLLMGGGVASATPQIETWQTANGAKVLFVAAPEIPMVDVAVVFDAGGARDGARPGLASLTAAMLDEGAGDWDADAIAERIDDVGASLGMRVERDMTVVSLRTLVREPAFDSAVATLSRVLTQPGFPAAQFERVRRNRVIALRQEQESPGAVAGRAFYQAVFGDHPYADDPDGTIESVQALSVADLAAFHQQYYVGANALVAIVGALDRQGAEALAERVVGALPAGARAPALPEVSALAQGVSKQIDFPSSQSTVLIGQPGMRRGDPDYFTLYVGNHILGGGGFVSRLVKVIREDHGLSYSTYSYFLPLAQRGPFTLALQTRNDQAGAARELLLETLRKFAAEGPSEAELTAAKKNITGGFPLRIASNGDIVGYLAVIGFYGLPLDYLARFPERIEAVTVAQIRDAFARRVDLDRLATVTVGGPTQPPPPADDGGSN